jgi:hypothetical protein
LQVVVGVGDGDGAGVVDFVGLGFGLDVVPDLVGGLDGAEDFVGVEDDPEPGFGAADDFAGVGDLFVPLLCLPTAVGAPGFAGGM